MNSLKIAKNRQKKTKQNKSKPNYKKKQQLFYHLSNELAIRLLRSLVKTSTAVEALSGRRVREITFYVSLCVRVCAGRCLKIIFFFFRWIIASSWQERSVLMQ